MRHKAHRSRTRPRVTSRPWLKLLGVLLVAAVLLLGFGYSEATRDPVVRTARITVPDLPADAGVVRILLMSDMHVQAPDMPPSRLARIVSEANALEPDIIVLAGDFTGENLVSTRKYSEAEAVAPLAELRARLGMIAVLGNNDRPHGDAATEALAAVGIRVLENRTVQLGPVAIGGFRTRYGSSIKRLLKRPPPRIVVSHSPDGFAELPEGIDLMLAGHTHCGQIVLPFVGALATGSEYGSRYLCGTKSKNGKSLVVTAGLGTSQVPIRIGAPPDMWLIELAPQK